MEDIASLVQTNPVDDTGAVTPASGTAAVFESNFSVMDGQTNCTYQPGTPADAIRRVDNARSEAFFAATREGHSRTRATSSTTSSRLARAAGAVSTCSRAVL